MTRRFLTLTVLTLLAAGCSKEPANAVAAKDPGPDNAMTRYAENLAQDERRAQEVANKANATIEQEQKMSNQATNQSTDQPQ